MPCVSLAHAAATTLGMILNRMPCDWRRQAMHAALSQTTSGPHLKMNNSALGVTLGPIRAFLLAPRQNSPMLR